MAITSTTRRAGPYAGNGATVAFSFAFKVFADSDLRVVHTSSGGVDTDLALGSAFTAVLNADQTVSPGGTVTVATAPATGDTLTILSDVPLTQPLDLQNAGGFYPEVINDAFDRVVIQVQQIAQTIGRAVTVSATSDISTELPSVLAGNPIGWATDGSGLANIDLETLAGAIAYGGVSADKFTGTGAQTAFALSSNPGSINNLDVSVNGVVKVPGDDYTLSGTTLTFLSAPANGHRVFVRFAQALPSGTVADGGVSSAAKVVDGILTPAKLTAGAPSWDGSGNVTASGTAQATGTSIVNGAAASLRGVSLRTAASVRWLLAANTTAEGGSNAGSNFVLNRYSDAGSLLGAAITVTRSTGAVALEAGLTVAGVTSFTSDAAFGSALAPTSTLSVGYRGVPQNAQNSNYTLALADAGRHVYSANSGAQTVTVPTNASVAFPIGTVVTLINNGTTAITVSTTSITMLQAGTTNTGNRTLATKGLATMIKVATDTWFISGAGVS